MLRSIITLCIHPPVSKEYRIASVSLLPNNSPITSKLITFAKALSGTPKSFREYFKFGEPINLRRFRPMMEKFIWLHTTDRQFIMSRKSGFLARPQICQKNGLLVVWPWGRPVFPAFFLPWFEGRLFVPTHKYEFCTIPPPKHAPLDTSSQITYFDSVGNLDSELLQHRLRNWNLLKINFESVYIF